MRPPPAEPGATEPVIRDEAGLPPELSQGLPDRLRAGLAERRLPGLDGLRCVAILGVIYTHMHLVPGHLGLIFFFVMSGFLITWMLLEEERRHGAVSLSAFYTRRCLRIFPAFYAAWLLIVVLLPPAGKPIPPGQAWSAFFYVSNYYQALFGVPRGTISHYWSLGVEEQFYLCWPLLFIAAGRLRWSRAKLLGGLIVAVWINRWVLELACGRSEYAYHAFDARADSILIGCLVAVQIHAGRWTGLWRRICAGPWRGLGPVAVLLLTTVLALVGRDRFRLLVGFILESLAIAVLLVQVITWHRHFLYRWLSWRPVAYVGSLSYAMYLLHMFAIERVTLQMLDLAAPVRWLLVSALVLVMAVVMHYAVERPFLRLKQRWSRVPPA